MRHWAGGIDVRGYVWHGVGSRGDWVLLLGQSWGDRAASGLAANDLLCLVGVVIDKVLGGDSNAGGLLGCELLNLDGLLVDNTGCVSNLLVDDLLVLLVDEWSEEENGSSDQCKTPERNNLDQVVGDEGRDEGLMWLLVKYIKCRVLLNLQQG